MNASLLRCAAFFCSQIILFNLSILNAQNLQLGDLAVLGVSANNFSCNGVSGGDEVSFVCFRDIETGMSLDVTDNGWERCLPNRWGDREGVVRFTRTGSKIPAGQVITWQLSSANGWGTYTFLSPDNGWTAANLNTAVALSTPINLNSGGDQLFFMQGGVWSNQTNPGGNEAQYLGGTLLFALNTDEEWRADCANAPTQNSNLPTILESCHQHTQLNKSDFSKYSGPFTPTDRLDWLRRINDPNNWTAFDDCSDYLETFPKYEEGFSLEITPFPASTWLGNSTLCAGEVLNAVAVTPQLGGPFSLSFSMNDSTFQLNNINGWQFFSLIPDTSGVLSLKKVSDLQGCSVQTDLDSAAFTVIQPDTVFFTERSCLSVNDTLYQMAKNQFGCDSLSIRFRTAIPEPLQLDWLEKSDFGGFGISCFGKRDGLLRLGANGGYGNFSANWSHGSTNFLQENLAAGQYFVTVSDGNQCTSTLEVNLTEPEPLRTIWAVEKEAECIEGGVVRLVSAAGGVAPYLFSLGNTGVLSSQSVWYALAPGNYLGTVEDAQGCTVEETLEISLINAIDTLALVDTLLFPGEGFDFDLPGAFDSVVFWSFPERSTFFPPNQLAFNPESGGVFQGKAMNSNGCALVFRFFVRIINDVPIYAPNILKLSISGDQSDQNSRFSLGYSSRLVNSVSFLHIYDRYGSLVFSADGESLPVWDGKIGGRNAQSGVYVWRAVLNLANGEEKLLSGSVTVCE